MGRTTSKSKAVATKGGIARAPRGLFGEVVCAGVDYITITSREVDGYALLSEYAARWLREELDRGHKLSSWYFRGFEGRTAGSVQAGSDGPTILIRLSGRYAWEYWPIALKYSTNVSRLDIQSTVRLRSVPPSFAEMCESQALRYEDEHRCNRQVELRRNSATGKTVYIGSPKSDRRIRIYDKGKESKLTEFKDCWRAEVQFNNHLAKRMAHQLTEWCSQGTFAEQTVFSSLARCGVTWAPVLAKPVLLAGPPRPRSSLEKKLTWLESQVQPTIKLLLEHYGPTKVLEALGLDHTYKGE